MRVRTAGGRAAALVVAVAAGLTATAACSVTGSGPTSATPRPSPTYSLCTGETIPAGATPAPAPAAGVDEVIRQADDLARGGHPTEAAELYRYRLEDNPADACAARGLAYLAAEPDQKPATGVGGAAAAWDTFYAGWVAPAMRLLLPFLLVLIALFLLARILTGVAVGPDAVSPDPERETGLTRRRRHYGSGVLALILAAGWATAGHTWFRLPGPWLVLGWAGAALIAAVGVWLVARGRGLALRIQVDGRNADGTANGIGSHVVARLQQLGSQRPRGVNVPQQTDVTTLPDDALSALPQGELAKALLRGVQTLLPAVPWQVTVTTVSDQTLAVMVTRNGRLVDSMVTTSPAPAADSPALAEVAPATAAAAFILATLARRHGALRRGLTGATRWRSIHLQVIATTPGVITDPARQKALLARAVEADPHNVSARVALLHVDGRRATDADAAAGYARGLDDVLAEINPAGLSDDVPADERRPPPGWAALHIRVLFNAAVAWMNHHTFQRADGQIDVARQSRAKAEHRLSWLIEILDAPERDVDLDELVADIRPATAYLHASIRAADGRPMQPPPAGAGGQLSLTALYTRACWHAAEQRLDRALDDLALAGTLQDYREWARIDPSFLVFRRADTPLELRRRFRRIVGPMVAAQFLELPPLSQHAAGLREYGVRGPDDLLAEDPQRLATALDVPLHVVRRWRELARLAGTRAGRNGDPVPAPLLYLLLAADIDRPALLRAALAGDRGAALRARLGTLAAEYAVDPSPLEDLDRWRLPADPRTGGLRRRLFGG